MPLCLQGKVGSRAEPSEGSDSNRYYVTQETKKVLSCNKRVYI
jgi:hypothetical protein